MYQTKPFFNEKELFVLCTIYDYKLITVFSFPLFPLVPSSPLPEFMPINSSDAHILHLFGAQIMRARAFVVVISTKCYQNLINHNWPHWSFPLQEGGGGPSHSGI